MRKVTVSRMRERYEQTVLTFRITYVFRIWGFQRACEFSQKKGNTKHFKFTFNFILLIGLLYQCYEYLKINRIPFFRYVMIFIEHDFDSCHVTSMLTFVEKKWVH